MIRPLKADLLIPEQLSKVIVRPCERIMRYAKEGAVCHLLHDAIDRLCGRFDVAREQPRIFCGFFDILFIGHPFNVVVSGFSKAQPSKNYGCEWFFPSRNHVKDGLFFCTNSPLAPLFLHIPTSSCKAGRAYGSYTFIQSRYYLSPTRRTINKSHKN